MKKNRFVMMLVLICFLLQACGPTGPVIYTLGSAWEKEGNRVTVQKTAVMESYTTDTGEEIQASTACNLLVVTCEIAVAEGGTVGPCQVSKNEAGAKSYAMYGEPIPLGSNEKMEAPQTFVLVFNIPSNEVTDGAIDDYLLDISLDHSGYRHTGTFSLKS